MGCRLKVQGLGCNFGADLNLRLRHSKMGVLCFSILQSNKEEKSEIYFRQLDID
jgi:hypothetical protein